MFDNFFPFFVFYEYANKSVIKVVDKQKESIEQIMNRFNLQEKIS